MKQALLILASYSLETLVNNIKQYAAYQDIFDIYIHIDSKLLDQFNARRIYITPENNMSAILFFSNITGLNNIKYIGHKYICSRFSFGLLLSEFFLLKTAFKMGKYSHYHIVSESCYIYKTPEYISKFFNDNKNIDFFEYWKHNGYTFKNHPTIKNEYKGPQWITLCHNTLLKIMQMDLFTQIYQDRMSDYILNTKNGALDETVLISYIIKYIYNEDIIAPNHCSKQHRLISWLNASDRPNVLTMSFYNKNPKEFSDEKLKRCIWARKINIKNNDSCEFLEFLKTNYCN